MQKSPYKFLDSYSKDDRKIFFGRDKEIEELYSRVFESKILIVYGTSGTGKSSLINCGLANKFNDSDWLPVTVRRGVNINRSLADSLDKLLLPSSGNEKKEQVSGRAVDILKVIRSIYLDHFKPVYLIFDQFEELFIFGSAKEKEDFIASIKRISDSDLQCRLIFSIREEYLAGFTEFEKIIPSFLNNRIRIEKMTRQNALQVIEGPCILNRIRVEPGFAEKLLDKLNPDNPDVELTYLQVFLDKVFRLASGNRKDVESFTSDLIDKAGDVKDLLGAFLEEQISQLDEPELGLVVLKSFVSVKGTKNQITESEVIEYSKTLGQDIDSAATKDLIQKFIRLRILRDKDENDRYELRHDTLATKIYEKVTLVEKELLEIRQFLGNAYENYGKRGLFLNDNDLKYIAPYEDKLFLNDKLSDFISESKRSIHKAKRRRQNILIATAITIIIILSFFSIWALRERGNAIEQKQLAEMQKNSAIKAKTEADSAKQEAVSARNLAVEKENLAVMAQKQAEQARGEAVRERENALEQKNLAEQLSIAAKEQAQIATNEKFKAEEERTKAVLAEEKATRLSRLSMAQNLALKSSAMQNNPELKGLLAVQAYLFNSNNNGWPEDPIIYDALTEAYQTLDSARHSVFRGAPSEARVICSKDNGDILTADLDCHIILWSPEGKVRNLYYLPYGSSVNFIGADNAGKRMVTQHENSDLLLWDLSTPGMNGFPCQKLSDHGAYVRCVAFSSDGRLLATAGRDSTATVWNVSEKPASIVASLKPGSGIRSMVFINDEKVVLAIEDGRLLIWDTGINLSTTLYSSAPEKPLCLAWDDRRKNLIAGLSGGTLIVFDMTGTTTAEPLKYPIHTSGIDIIRFSDDYSLMATSSWDKTIKIIDYNEYFGKGNLVGGARFIKYLNSRIRSMAFSNDNKLLAGMADQTIRIWETSSERLAEMICDLANRNMTSTEWNEMVGTGIPYEKTCGR